jgi:hypothetical protein
MDNLEQVLKDIQDYLAPRLDTYEQAIYLYVFRHTLHCNSGQHSRWQPNLA